VLRDRLHQVLLWAIGILVFVVNTMVIITFYTGCDPTQKSWDPLIKGKCWPVDKKLAFFLLQGAFSAFSDFFLAFSPFFFLYKLQLKRKTKALVIGLMGLGAVTGVFAIIRTVETGTQLHPLPNATPDVSYSTVMGLMWAGMERNIAILAGSIPALNPLAAPAAKFITRTLGLSRSKLNSARSHSYQLSDVPRPHKMFDDDIRRQNYAIERTQKTGVPMTTTTSEEYIITGQGREIA